MDTGGEGEGRTKGERSMKTYMLPYVKQTASGNLLYDSRLRELKPGALRQLEGWDGVGGGREI